MNIKDRIADANNVDVLTTLTKSYELNIRLLKYLYDINADDPSNSALILEDIQNTLFNSFVYIQNNNPSYMPPLGFTSGEL